MTTTQSIIAVGVALLVGFAGGWALTGTDAKTSNISWKYGDSELVIDLEKDLATDETLLEKIFSTPYSSAGAENWLKTTQSLFPYDDPDLATRLADLDYDSVSARELRELRRKRVGPFAHQYQEVVLSFPGPEYTRLGKANACSNGIFYRKKVEIFLEDNPDRRITVEVLDPFTCTGRTTLSNGRTVRSDIQISYADAHRLFGDEPLEKYMRAVAVVVD